MAAFLFFSFFHALEQDGTALEGGGEKENIAAIAQTEFLAQLVGREMEIAGGDIGMADALQRLGTCFFVEREHLLHVEHPTGERTCRCMAHEEMAVGRDGAQSITMGEHAEAPAFHDARIRFAECADSL